MSTHKSSDSAEPAGDKSQKISSTAVRQMVLSTAIMALVFISLTQAFIILRNNQQILESEEKKHNSYLLADELRQSSDDLTRMARTYSQTLDKRFADYFQEILDIRNGNVPRPEKYNNIYWDFVVSTGERPRSGTTNVPLNALMKKAGFTDAELELLEKAENESNALVNLEVQAMNAIVGLYRDASGKYTVQGKPDPELARRLLYSDNYHKWKERIMSSIEQFFEMSDKRTGQEIKLYKNRERIMLFLLIGTISLAALLAIVSIIMMADSARKL